MLVFTFILDFLLISQQASTGASTGAVGRGFGGPGGPPGEQVQVKVPNNKVTTYLDPGVWLGLEF